MAILKLAQLGEPVLRAVAKPLDARELHAPETKSLIDDMIETMRDADGVGIAAPQVFASLRVVAIEVRNVDRYRDAEIFPLLVVINPVVTSVGRSTREGWEGCLSVGDLRGRVPRHERVRLEGLLRDGTNFIDDLDGFPAIVAQHEVDHLNGLIYLDRMREFTSLAFEREYRRYHLANVPPSDETTPEDDHDQTDAGHDQTDAAELQG